MFKLFRTVIYLLSIFSCVQMHAQEKSPIKYGKITTDDFSISAPLYDSGAHAVIIGDIGRSKITPNNSGGFGYEFERKLRVKIMDLNGISAGKFEIPLYFGKNSDSKEELISLKAITYNLENGKVVSSKLENDQVFTEKSGKYVQLKKFSLPGLKAGSVFEISYAIKSDFLFDFRPWQFQGEYPCIWSEYETEIPGYYEYVFLIQGYLPFHINKKSVEARTFLIRNTMGLQGGLNNTFTMGGLVNINTWVVKDIPGLKEEKFTTSLENNRSKIDFQLSSIQYPDQQPQLVMESWPKVSKDFMENSDFGADLLKPNMWMDDDLQKVVGNVSTQYEKALKVYNYIRDNFTCTQKSGKYLTAGLKSIVKIKSGNVADINLLLIAMLKHMGMDAYPILLSTRSHGVANSIHPLLDRYNYVACYLVIDDNNFLLDATSPGLAFGKLNLNCYNGPARVLTEKTIPLMLVADSIVERNTNFVQLGTEIGSFKGRVSSAPGYYESLYHRDYIREKGKDAFFDKIRQELGSDFTVSNTEIDSLVKLEDPIKVSYDLAFKTNGEELIYFNPVLIPFYKENPFSALVRLYPVEMPYRIDETYLLNFLIPEGYMVDEIPKSSKVKLNEYEGVFEYLVSAENGLIQLRTRLILSKANFPSEDYESLREFFSYVVKKQSEQIVLKKK